MATALTKPETIVVAALRDPDSGIEWGAIDACEQIARVAVGALRKVGWVYLGAGEDRAPFPITFEDEED